MIFKLPQPAINIEQPTGELYYRELDVNEAPRIWNE